MHSPYLLLIEDNQDDVLLTLRTLRSNRCALQVRTVYDGFQALEFLSNAAALPAVVLLNPSLPGMDGYELLHSIRCDPRTERLPILLFSGTEEECLPLSSATEAGTPVEGCVLKPLDWPTFRERLRRLGLGTAGREAKPRLASASNMHSKRLF
ncbi:MAG TPA: response regulator [Trueperaceae bacterium]